MDSSYSYSSSGDPAAAAAALVFSLCYMLFMLGFAAIFVAGLWKIFSKAGKPGWAALVPIYNMVVLMQVVGRPAWWVILFFVPGANIIVQIITSLDLAKVFGKGSGYGIGLILLPGIFHVMLGFGKSVYVGTGAPAAYAPPPYYPPQQ